MLDVCYFVIFLIILFIIWMFCVGMERCGGSFVDGVAEGVEWSAVEG